MEIIGYGIFWIIFIVFLITGIAPDIRRIYVKRKDRPYEYWGDMAIFFAFLLIPLLIKYFEKPA
jgi:phosphate starvation-inducible membrane PsiE